MINDNFHHLNLEKNNGRFKSVAFAQLDCRGAEANDPDSGNYYLVGFKTRRGLLHATDGRDPEIFGGKLEDPR